MARCAALIRRTAFATFAGGVPALLEVASRRAPPVTTRGRRQPTSACRCELVFPVTRTLFGHVEAMWEAPAPDELAGSDAVRVTA